MTKFIKEAILFAIPILLFFAITVGTFFLFDPFKILNEYEVFNNSIVSYNEDYIATERFLKNKTQYNSFILGSSRAGCGFRVSDWEKKLGNTAQVFSFAASNESIFGIWGKVRLLDEENAPIDHVLLVIDTDITMKRTVNSNGHIFIKHPRVSGESETAFISEYLKDYIFTGFFVRYLDYKMFEEERSYMKGFLNFAHKSLEEQYIPFNINQREARILDDEAAYYQENTFYDRPAEAVSAKSFINSKSIGFMKDIKAIFDKHQTNYKIVISPLYDQKKIHELDLKAIQEIFAKENVFDYSGKNAITDDKHNYYETSHYRIGIGQQIINRIYDDLSKE